MQPESWQESKAFSDLFLPACQQLLGLTCMQIADIDEDRRHNTDLMLKGKHRRYAVRVRRAEQRLEWNRRNEITFRLGLPSGMETELDKLMNGWGDVLLYAWGDEATRRLVSYSLVDLDVLRGWIFRETLRLGRLPGDVQRDQDGSATFVAFCLDCLPPEVIMRRRTAIPGDPANTDRHWRRQHDPNYLGGAEPLRPDAA
jgi:hypothetical protein